MSMSPPPVLRKSKQLTEFKEVPTFTSILTGFLCVEGWGKNGEAFFSLVVCFKFEMFGTVRERETLGETWELMHFQTFHS